MLRDMLRHESSNCSSFKTEQQLPGHNNRAGKQFYPRLDLRSQLSSLRPSYGVDSELEWAMQASLEQSGSYPLLPKVHNTQANQPPLRIQSDPVPVTKKSRTQVSANHNVSSLKAATSIRNLPMSKPANELSKKSANGLSKKPANGLSKGLAMLPPPTSTTSADSQASLKSPMANKSPSQLPSRASASKLRVLKPPTKKGLDTSPKRLSTNGRREATRNPNGLPSKPSATKPGNKSTTGLSEKSRFYAGTNSLRPEILSQHSANPMETIAGKYQVN